MPVPSTINELALAAISNFPQATDSAKGTIDNYLRSHAGFIAELRDSYAGLPVTRAKSVFNEMTGSQRADVIAGTYSLDHTAAINAASAACGAGTLYFPAGCYRISSKLVQPAGQKWVGEGGQRGTTIKKFFNGDMIDLGDLGVISDINLDANGPLYTGRGIRVMAGFSQKIKRIRVSQSADNCLYFAPGAGGGTSINGFEGDTTSPGTVGAIKIGSANSGPCPIFMTSIWLSGGVLDLTDPGAGNGCSISNFYIRNVLTAGPATTGSALFHMANGRFATLGDTTTLSGSDFSIASVAFSGPVVLSNAQGYNLIACTYGAGIIEDSVTCNSNKYENSTSAFSPAWTQASGIQPSVGNGSLIGFYLRNGAVCSVSLRLVIGTTTTTGNAASGWVFSLPFLSNPSAGFNQRISAAANIYSNAAGLDYPAQVTIPTNTASFTLGRNGAGVRDGFPVVWAAGDTIDIQFEYIVK